MEALIYLTYLAVVLLLGVILTVLSSKIKVSSVLLLVVAGIVLGSISYKGKELMSFPTIFLVSIAIVALVMVVFDSCSRLKLKEFDTFSFQIIKLTAIILVLNMTILAFATKYAFGISSWITALIFGALMSGTDPSSVLSMMTEKSNKIEEILKIESIINTPINVLIPFILIDFAMSITEKISVGAFIAQISPFLQLIVTGIGAGIVVGIILFKIMKRWFSSTLSPIAMITAALLTYVIAETLHGNGVLAVTTMGVFFGTMYVKQKEELQEFSAAFSKLFEILVFILVGVAIKIPRTPYFLAYSFGLYILYLVLRFIAVSFLFKSPRYILKEKIFMAVAPSKGITVAVIAFALAPYTANFPELKTVLDLSLAFMIYSILFSTVMMKFSGFFLREGRGKKEGMMEKVFAKNKAKNQ